MSGTVRQDWKIDFGLDDQRSPYFFSSSDQLEAGGVQFAQRHILRRAFEQMNIAGVLCQKRTDANEGLHPLIYFYQTETIETEHIRRLHRAFWNQGIAPILVVISPDEIHVHSGLSLPLNTVNNNNPANGLVEKLRHVTEELQAFLLSVETGEYFRHHQKYFNPDNRVDRYLLRNLNAAREELKVVKAPVLAATTLDALLFRLVFTSYLFDRKIIDQDYLEACGVYGIPHLYDILSRLTPVDAKEALYNKLFRQLAQDFNGDLFSTDLEAEQKNIGDEHVSILSDFFQGTEIHSGQMSLWPYDFAFIPIETISAIYEHFLKAAGEEERREAGAFYTPRFLAEFVLDVALEGETGLLDKRFLDPACGSGIFLVGLFNRLAEEWKVKHPDASYEQQAQGLLDILRNNLQGVDSNRSACHITAFSLYLAFLDQLAPPDIRRLLGRWQRLPHLVTIGGEPAIHETVGTIQCVDFFSDAISLPQKVHFVIGNPPWGPVKQKARTIAEQWCADPQRRLALPNREKSIPFIWKAAIHLEDEGKVCFILPHGILFNHNATAIRFQQSLLRTHCVERVINLTDFQFFLFEESDAPALVMRYSKEKPINAAQQIEYWVPKTDWGIARAELISILPQDRHQLTLRELLTNLQESNGALIWKTLSWATARDQQFIERLSLFPRLGDVVGQKSDSKRWMIAEGFQPHGQNDDPKTAQPLHLPTDLFIHATSQALDLFTLEADCELLPSNRVIVRSRSNKNTHIYKAPHVLISKGFSRVAFADFDVSFRHALRGVHGPMDDRELLMFLAAYLRSNLARYFLFHTSSNWGVTRAEVHVGELLRLPFPLPEQTRNPRRAIAIVQEVADEISIAMKRAVYYAERGDLVRRTQRSIEVLIEEYFDINKIERIFIEDTTNIIIPSVRPTRNNKKIATLNHIDPDQHGRYSEMLCNRLNSWAKEEYKVEARVIQNNALGVGMVVLEKLHRMEAPHFLFVESEDILQIVYDLQRTASRKHGTFELVRGAKIFSGNLLYIIKPLGQRFWSQTAALNDADEIAATILMRSERETL